MPFLDRVAVITGAGGYIGGETVRQFLRHGVAVAMTDINFEPLEELARNLGQDGCRIKAYRHDVSNRADTQDVFEEILRDYGKIDILVNNAGVWEHSDVKGQQPFDEMSPSEWERIVAISLHGTGYCMQAALPAMKKAKYGRIINLGSIAGNCGLPGYADYSSAKAGVAMLSKVAAMESAPYNITVNVVSPGLILREPILHDGTWLGRSGNAYDVARTVLFLADDDAGYITGVDILVDGGRVLGPHNCNMRT